MGLKIPRGVIVSQLDEEGIMLGSTSVNKSKVGAAGRQVRTIDKRGGGLATFLPKINKSKDAIIENFHRGDLMYGTSAGRDVSYLNKLERYHRDSIVNGPAAENNEWARKNVRSTRSMVINSYSDPVRSALSNEFARLKKNGGEFKSAILGLAISMAKIGRSERNGFDFESYQKIASGHEKLKISSKHVDEWLWWKRGSKSGIEMVAQQSPTSGRRLHFILDGMNILGVVNKDENLFGNSITASELRYIYRHWNRLKGRVIFYRDQSVVDAPWEDRASPHLWNGYAIRRRSAVPHLPPLAPFSSV